MKTNLAEQIKKWAITVSQESVSPLMVEKLGKFSAMALDSEKETDVFTYTYESDGIKVAGFLVAPKKRSKKLPVIIYNRGGTSDYGLLLKGRLFTRLAHLARWGYIVVGTQYPGNALSEGSDERGGTSDVNSVLRLHDLITTLDDADKNNIGMYGESRGGMMTYLCMKQVTWIKAALTVGGLANLERSLEYRPEMVEIYEKHFGNTAEAKNARSVVKWADKLNKTTPLCLLHGAEDDKVNIRDALELAEKLDEAQHPFSLHILNGGDHGLMHVQKERDGLIHDWFERYLKGE